MCRGLAVAAIAAALTVCCARGREPAPEQAPASPAAADASTSPRNCARLDLTPLKVVRVDEPQRRLFVVAPDAATRPLEARLRDLESCFDFTDWAGRWSLSVFTAAEFARYKDDPLVADAVKDGRWAKAYVAEYDAARKELTRRPAEPQ